MVDKISKELNDLIASYIFDDNSMGIDSGYHTYELAWLLNEEKDLIISAFNAIANNTEPEKAIQDLKKFYENKSGFYDKKESE